MHGGAVGAGAGAIIGNKMDKAKKQAQQVQNAQVETVKDTNGLDAVKVTFDSGILFATGKADLSTSAKNSLAEFARVLNSNQDCDVAIIGHTDNTGTDAVNQPLSVNRANSVSSYLRSCGVQGKQIKSVEGQGSTNPVADNSTAAGRFFASTILSVVVLRWVPVWFTPLMFIRLGQQMSQGRELTLHHHWVPYDEISPSLSLAVMGSEDARFLEHHGFDYKAIEHAAIRNLKHPEKRKLGASTISQQTAKNVFLWPGRSWVRKGFEVYFTALIELFWSKQRIMEVYLNSIEMGDGIYGADAVAEWHFHKTASGLTKAECALIAATLPNPLRYNSAKPSAYVLKRQKRILHEMRYVKPAM